MNSCQFIRCHVYQADKISGILAEADRQPGYTSHVEKPLKVNWVMGDPLSITQAIAAHMAVLAPVRALNGNIVGRKRRKDHRVLVAGTISWPDSIEVCRNKEYPRERLDALKRWYDLLKIWLRKNFGEKLIGICSHLDESHPHIHFFVVGDAQRLHPGMKNELVANERMKISKDRFEAHKVGLRAWLDDYHENVGEPCGLERRLNSRPSWRIKDRGTRSKLFEIEKLLAERPNSEIKSLVDDTWDSEWKSSRPKMRF